MNFTLLQSKLKHGRMSEKDMERLEQEYESYSPAQRYLIRKLIKENEEKYGKKLEAVDKKIELKKIDFDKRINFAYSKADAVIGWSGVACLAACAVAVAVPTLGITVAAPYLAGAAAILGGIAIVDTIRNWYNAKKGKYDEKKMVKLHRHPIIARRKRVFALKQGRLKAAWDIVTGNKKPAEVKEAVKETQTPVVEPAKVEAAPVVVNEAATLTA
ncbi:MAG: hypothetical protein IKQ31_04570 [Clostridia bacterium]|nr:hypothetical protein [Clostridia bacterium]